MCFRSFILSWVSLRCRSASVSPLWFRSFKSRDRLSFSTVCPRISLLFRAFFSLLHRPHVFVPRLSRMYRLFVSRRPFIAFLLSFTLIRSIKLMFSLISAGRSCCTSIYDFVSFYVILVTFVKFTDHIFFRIRSFPTVGPGTSSKSLAYTA